MIVRLLHSIYVRTLESVVFGIFLMLLVGLYVALGSGFPELREYFEMDELQFFSAWPLKLLMILLVSNLVIVTIRRIPFTPPRYGVWMVHAGIILLIYGLAFYYSFKTEGDIRILKGQTISHYYVKGERALYMRLNNVPLDAVALPSLPRFKIYDQASGNEKRLDREDLHNIVPTMNAMDPQRGMRVRRPLTEELKLGSNLKLDIVGYYPYASIQTQAVNDTQGTTAIELTGETPQGEQIPPQWLQASIPSRSALEDPVARIEHRALSATELAELIKAAEHLHKLEVVVGEHRHEVYVEPGANYTIGDTGWRLEVESYDPVWQTMQRETVQLLTFMVHTPEGAAFRRQVIPGREMPTDWKLNVAGSGPMGERQSKPLDDRLITTYSVEDPLKLLPVNSTHQIVLVTTDAPGITLVATGIDHPLQVENLANGTGALRLQGAQPGANVHVARHDNVRIEEQVVVTPPEKRQRDESGVYQVALIRATYEPAVTLGMPGLSILRIEPSAQVRDVAVPFTQWAGDSGWSGGYVPLGDTGLQLQLQLGNTRMPIPARVTLDDFELEHYMGANEQTARMFRDFKSKITLQEIKSADPQTGMPRMSDPVKAEVHMNNPVYFGGITGGQWTLFQSAWDPEGQRFTVLGVGNRPGVWFMTIGSVVMVFGLLYAFYLKPIIIARMKARALREAAEKKKPVEQVQGSFARA